MSRKRLIDSKDAIDEIVKRMLDVLNEGIREYDLTYEDALSLAERIRLHILAKYIDFRLLRMVELTSRIFKDKEKEVIKR